VPETIHIHPTAALAERVLLPGDPGRALLLCQSLLSEPKMFNHNRGLWGYTGTGADGRPLTIQSTGIGGPSAAIVAGELHRLGARRLVQVGTCAALDPALALGDLLIAERALAGDGTSRSLGAGEVVDPTPDLLARLTAGAGGAVRRCLVATSDLLYEDLERPEPEWLAAGAAAVEMESATLFMLAARRGFQVASVLIVSDLLPSRRRIKPEPLVAAEERAGALAAAALG
jgi:uridine phosphorylase